MQQDPSLIDYPCAFPIKIMGHTRTGFAQAMLEIVRRHAPDFDGATLEMKSSKHGKYLSITCTINAISRARRSVNSGVGAPTPSPWTEIFPRPGCEFSFIYINESDYSERLCAPAELSSHEFRIAAK